MSNINKQALRERYSLQPVPKCHICDTVMTIARASAGAVMYACSGCTYDDNGAHYASGRSLGDDHYSASRVTIFESGDHEVLALLDELEAAEKRVAELESLAAGMEQDPVAYTCSDALDDVYCGSAAMMGPVGAVGEVPLYTAPQLPQPAVPDMAAVGEMPFLGTQENAFVSGWNACRAAMLQAGNHTEQHLDMVDHFVDASEKGKDGTLINEGTMPATQIKPVADLYGITSPTGSETTFTFDAGEASSFVGSGWTVQEYVELERYQEAITGK